MKHSAASLTLLERTLMEEAARHEAADAAIAVRAADINEAGRLTAALAARGYNVRDVVLVQQVGSLATVRIQIWLSCTLDELGRALACLTDNDITISRDLAVEAGDVRCYQLQLRGQILELRAAVHGGPLRLRPQIVGVAA